MGRAILLTFVAGFLDYDVDAAGDQAINLEMTFAVGEGSSYLRRKAVDPDQSAINRFSGYGVHNRTAQHEGLAALRCRGRRGLAG